MRTYSFPYWHLFRAKHFNLTVYDGRCVCVCVCVCVWFQPCMCSRLPCTHNIQLIKADCSLSQAASCLLPPRVSPTLSPVCLFLSPPLTLCLSVFLQEEKGISCGLVDLDFLKCSVGFPFMRAQTKVARTNMEFIARRQNCMQTTFRVVVLSVKNNGVKTNSNYTLSWKTVNDTLVYSVFSSPVSFCGDIWHESALRGKWHIAVLSSSEKVSVMSLTF